MKIKMPKNCPVCRSSKLRGTAIKFQCQNCGYILNRTKDLKGVEI